MDRTGIFIDAGYLFASGSVLLCGEKLRRGEIHLENKVFLEFIRNKAAQLTGLPLLRVYWYDGTDGPPTPKHIALAYQPDVKLRLGLVNRQGAQKGVDSLIVTDLINLSRNRAMASAVLLTGDEDIRVGVLQAQEYGVRVHLVGVAVSSTSENNQAALLKQEADDVCDLSLEEVRTFMVCRRSTPTSALPADAVGGPAPTEVPPTQVSHRSVLLPADKVSAIVQATLSQMDEESIQQVASAGRYSIPAHLDGILLTTATRLLAGGRVPDGSKKQLRDAFFAACQMAARA